MNRALLIILIVAITLLSCSTKNEASKGNIIAQVGNKFLYLNELPVIDGNEISEIDSISYLKGYIDRWIKKELLLSRAELNLTKEYVSEINKKLNETKANLMIYQYQQQMMYQKMDTLVSQSEILDYYNKNIQTFSLRNHLVKALYIKIPKEAPNIVKVKKWYKSVDAEDFGTLESYCIQFADKFDDFNEDWININDLLRLLPDESNRTNTILSHRYYETTDMQFEYLVDIIDFRLKGAESPLEYVIKDIKNIILNNRKIVFLENLENGIYKNALKENTFKIY